MIDSIVKDFVTMFGNTKEDILSAVRTAETPSFTLQNPEATVSFNKLRALVLGTESNKDLGAIIAQYSQPSVTTALKLLQIIADIHKGDILLKSDIGLYFLDCLNNVVGHVHDMASALATFVIELVSKILTIAQKKLTSISPDALTRLKDIGRQMIYIVKATTLEGAKNPLIELSQTDLYQSILYTVVLAVNYLELPLEDTQNDIEKTQADVQDSVVDDKESEEKDALGMLPVKKRYICPKPESFIVKSAWYGSEKGVNGKDVTEIVQNVLDTGAIGFLADNDLFDDPEPGVEKKCFVAYSWSGVDDEAEINEGDFEEFPHLSCPIRQGLEISSDIEDIITMNSTFEVDREMETFDESVRATYYRLHLADGRGWTTLKSVKDGKEIVYLRELSHYSLRRVSEDVTLNIRETLDLSGDVIGEYEQGQLFECIGIETNSEGMVRAKLARNGYVTIEEDDGTKYTTEVDPNEIFPVDERFHDMPYTAFSVGVPGQYMDGWRCDRCSRNSPSMSAELAAGRYHCSECSADICVECFVLNRVKVPMFAGDEDSDEEDGVPYYCGRDLGEHLIPDSDGCCGPNSGPQCLDCRGYTKSKPPHMPRNQHVVTKKGSLGENVTVIESPHPYEDGSDIYRTIAVPGATGYVIKFSPGNF
jgi:hypothetical protein